MAAAIAKEGEDKRERLLRVLSAATFLIFFQAYMVAPLIPRLSTVFGVSSHTIGFIVPMRAWTCRSSARASGNVDNQSQGRR